MNKRVAQALWPEVTIEELAEVTCLYCLDTKRCKFCKGERIVPPVDAATGKPNNRGGRVLCEFCKGEGDCPHCADSEPEAA